MSLEKIAKWCEKMAARKPELAMIELARALRRYDPCMKSRAEMYALQDVFADAKAAMKKVHDKSGTGAGVLNDIDA
jgi:DNA-directed RNA polymerase specialized sigma subunit